MNANLALTRHLKKSKLFSTTSTQFIISLASRFPLVSGLIIESSLLITDTAAADLSFRFLRSANEFPILATLCLSLINESSGKQANIWKRISLFVNNCIESCEYGEIESIWLEFDEEQLGDTFPIPGLFFNICQQSTKQLSLIKSCISLFQGVETIANMTEILEKINLNNKREASIHSAGVFFSRDPCIIRLNVSVPSTELQSCLIDIESSIGADLSQVVSILEHAGIENILVNFNIFPLLVFAGIEIKESDNLSWPKIFKILRKTGWCDFPLIPILMKWPSFSNTLKLIDSLELVSIEPKRALPYFFVRRINHIKLYLNQKNIKTAKVYLFEGYGWKK